MISQPSPFQTAALKAKAFGSRIITLDLDKQRSINTRVSLVQLLQRIHPFCTVKRQKKLVQLHAKILAQLGHEVLLAASQSLQYYKCGFRKSRVLTYFRCCGEDFQKKAREHLHRFCCKKIETRINHEVSPCLQPPSNRL